MKRTLLLLLVLMGQRLDGALPDHSVSPSRQFVIYGSNTIVRGAVSEIAEQTKENLLNILRQPDRWKTTIVINLQSPQANIPEIPASELRFSQTGFGLKLQLDLTVDRRPDSAAIERELLRAILLEMMYRDETNLAPGTAFAEPPDWLLDGILALKPGSDRRTLVEALTLSDRVMPLDEFLRQRPALLDSPGRLLFRAHSYALVQLLSDGTDRRSRLARYLNDLPRTSGDSLADLKTQFPFLRDDTADIWKSTVRGVKATLSSQLLGFDETEQQLRELLRIKSPRDKSAPVELNVFLTGKISPADKTTLTQLGQGLVLLGSRANPVMRPIVREYEQIVASIIAGKRRKLSQRLSRLKTTRTDLSSRMGQISDYMNWFEATQSQARSEMFADYLDAASESAEPPPRRRDALSVYLDSLEDQF